MNWRSDNSFIVGSVGVLGGIIWLVGCSHIIPRWVSISMIVLSMVDFVNGRLLYLIESEASK